MRMFQALQPREVTQIAEPPIAKFFFADTRMAILWVIVRLYVGYEWFTAGFEKMFGRSIFGEVSQGGPWIFSGHDGAAMAGFATGALAKATGAHPAVQGWYAWFLQNVVLPNSAVFAYIITFGEILVGLGLIVGCLTGIAAFFGLVMNLNFLLAGTVSINPVLGVLALFIVLAWRIAGYYGVDRYLLPLLGTPWTGSLAHKKGDVTPKLATS
jgi:thiosulfate dehydrogenase [quinone] large subunit